MPFRWNPKEQFSLLTYLLKWTLMLCPVAFAIGSACAFFLYALDMATQLRWREPWLLFLLPVAGLAIGCVYHWLGKPAEGGNNLIVEQIHEPGGGVPVRMAPLVLFGTLLTHLFGGSAGREGTAVQMGGSIAGAFARIFKFNANGTPEQQRTLERTLLMAGVAAGFGAVFGTPLTGAIFAMEVLSLGGMNYRALFPCLFASIVGDWSCSVWGIVHTSYHITLGPAQRVDPWLLGKVALASIAFGAAGRLFAEMAHGFQFLYKKFIPSPVLRPAVGGMLVIALVYLVGSRDYLGIGVTPPPLGLDGSRDFHGVCIVSAFHAGGAESWSWLLKIIFTCVTISSGFKGGEVTPLFFVGATLGNVLAILLNAPVDLFAGLGFVAVFAAAANTPLACTIMGIELFGSRAEISSGYTVYFAVACVLAYLFSGHSGIYLSQKIGTPKIHSPEVEGDTSLRTARHATPSIFHRKGWKGPSGP